jgi:hypothetical protein
MLRVCAFSRPKQDLLPGLEDVTLWDDATSACQLPSLQQVTAKQVRVVVVTALMAAKVGLWLTAGGLFFAKPTQACVQLSTSYCLILMRSFDVSVAWPAVPPMTVCHAVLCLPACSQLHALGVPAGHFTHIMFDEAGQAGELVRSPQHCMRRQLHAASAADAMHSVSSPALAQHT